MKPIEVKVSVFSESMRFYQIHWRFKRRFNLFNRWKVVALDQVWDGVELDEYHPLLFNNIQAAVDFSEELKNDPTKLKIYSRI